jgi:hypothetical protein
MIQLTPYKQLYLGFQYVKEHSVPVFVIADTVDSMNYCWYFNAELQSLDEAYAKVVEELAKLEFEYDFLSMPLQPLDIEEHLHFPGCPPYFVTIRRRPNHHEPLTQEQCNKIQETIQSQRSETL